MGAAPDFRRDPPERRSPTGFKHEIRNRPLPFIPILLMFNTACW